MNAGELPALGHRAGGNRAGGVHEHHLEEEQREHADVVRAAAQEEALEPEQAEGVAATGSRGSGPNISVAKFHPIQKREEGLVLPPVGDDPGRDPAVQVRRQRGAAVVDALPHFLHGVGALRHVVFELDRRRDLPLVLPHHLQDLLDRRLAGAPRQVERAVLRRRPILQVEAGDAVVVLLQELHRRAADVAGRDPVAEIDVGLVALRQRRTPCRTRSCCPACGCGTRRRSSSSSRSRRRASAARRRSAARGSCACAPSASATLNMYSYSSSDMLALSFFAA